MNLAKEPARHGLRALPLPGLMILTLLPVSVAAGADKAEHARLVFVGDSITDGHTYPQLIRQALAEADKPVPVVINAGIGGDTARGMRQRIERDALIHRPTLVTLSVGINDVLRKVKVADYESDVNAIAERLNKEKIPLLILTTSILGPKNAEADKKLADYNAILRKVAVKHGYKVAEVNALMQKERAAGRELLESDQVHPNYEGQRLIARAVLDALGYPEVPVPKELKLKMMPGVIRSWRLRVAPKGSLPLDEKTVATLKPDETWKALTLPEQEKQEQWWLDHERQRGFAVSVDKHVGKGGTYEGVAVLESDSPKNVYFNTGAQLQTIWLNGKRIYKNEGWTGWHAGKERIAARVKEGKNTVVIETSGQFFLSVTDTNDW